MTTFERFPDVMLLAAGLGQRLRPLTQTVPKPLVRVAGTALIDRVIANARAEGASRFVVNTHHLGDRVAAHFAGHGDFTVLGEDVLLDTGGGVRNALPHLIGDPVLVMNTDAFWLPGADRPLARLRARHQAMGAAATLLCARPGRATGFARSHDFCLDPLGRVTLDAGRPVIYAGTALLERSLFEDMPDGPFSLYKVFEKALAVERVAGAILDASWFHVGDPQGLAAVEEVLR
jgi:MurNAc alpha-1-phosphate uridylyltransferase